MKYMPSSRYSHLLSRSKIKHSAENVRGKFMGNNIIHTDYQSLIKSVSSNEATANKYSCKKRIKSEQRER